MYEPDPGVELCVPCQAFFEAGHADQYDANFTGIEYGAYLFKATYSETIRLIETLTVFASFRGSPWRVSTAASNPALVKDEFREGQSPGW